MLAFFLFFKYFFNLMIIADNCLGNAEEEATIFEIVEEMISEVIHMTNSRRSMELLTESLDAADKRRKSIDLLDEVMHFRVVSGEDSVKGSEGVAVVKSEKIVENKEGDGVKK